MVPSSRGAGPANSSHDLACCVVGPRRTARLGALRHPRWSCNPCVRSFRAHGIRSGAHSETPYCCESYIYYAADRGLTSFLAFQLPGGPSAPAIATAAPAVPSVSHGPLVHRRSKAAHASKHLGATATRRGPPARPSPIVLQMIFNVRRVVGAPGDRAATRGSPRARPAMRAGSEDAAQLRQRPSRILLLSAGPRRMPAGGQDGYALSPGCFAKSRCNSATRKGRVRRGPVRFQSSHASRAMTSTRSRWGVDAHHRGKLSLPRVSSSTCSRSRKRADAGIH